MTYSGMAHDDAFDHLPPRKLKAMDTVHLPEPQPLGQLVWWQVLKPSARHEDLVALYAQYHLGEAPPRPSLADAFRRETGPRVKTDYQLTQQVSVTLSLHSVKTGKDLHIRDVVRTAGRKNRRQGSVEKVGTLAYDGRDGQVHLGVEPAVRKLPDRERIEKFILDIRAACHEGAASVDAQAGRRLVRRFLSVTDAVLFEGGPYFLPREQDAESLMALLARLGGSSGFYTPFVDGERQRELLATTLANTEGLPAKTVGTYRALLGQKGR